MPFINTESKTLNKMLVNRKEGADGVAQQIKGCDPQDPHGEGDQFLHCPLTAIYTLLPKV